MKSQRTEQARSSWDTVKQLSCREVAFDPASSCYWNILRQRVLMWRSSPALISMADFTRWFHKLTGKTPREFRHPQRKAGQPGE
jgi:hypothetical protein